tara:strand:- start:1769 stop:2431 length:663 start_codon:yes stop_codon:yes gene_type:complete
MAYINITGDSDGDLHTAAMHNSKFGAIASVLNGNVDHDNLTYPKSLFTWNFTTNKSYVVESGGGAGVGYSDITLLHATNKTIGTLDGVACQPATTAGAYNVLLSSYTKAPVALEHVATSVICINNSNFTTSANMELIFQVSSSLAGGTGTYSDIASVTFDPDTASSALTPTELSMSYSSNTISANNFFRIIYRNPTSGSLAGDIMPNLKISITWKALTVS